MFDHSGLLPRDPANQACSGQLILKRPMKRWSTGVGVDAPGE
jgi:hypothetical protein